MASPRDTALQPARILHPDAAYADSARMWQGIPGIDRAPGGRLWAVWYSGGMGEGPGNYAVLATSTDHGGTWSAPLFIVEHPDPDCRVFDPVLWTDPQGRLWLFWAQGHGFMDGRWGVWASHTEQPDDVLPTWSTPVRIADGVMMNKPTVLPTGEWLAPVALWIHGAKDAPALDAERFSNVFVSLDHGATWTRRGGADCPNRWYDEHMVAALGDGRLWMLVRTRDGLGESFSSDRGVTWSPGTKSALAGPDSRFHLRRLSSGRLLLVNHVGYTGRSHLTALLSEDDGATWPYHLLLDERKGVSYPDATEAPGGVIHIIYDHCRGDRHSLGDDREILLATCSEKDILNGTPSPDCRLRQCVSKATAPNPDWKPKA